MSRRVMILLGLVVVACAGAGAYWYFTRPRPVPVRPAIAAGDPRREYTGGFQNISPDVKYVGDAACSKCHAEIAKKYATHPMGRSMSSVSATSTMESLGPTAHNPFDQFGYHYRVEPRDGKIVHVEERRDSTGKTVVVNESEARFAIGSGTRGKSFLVQRGDCLFQSPISWFSEKKIWDLSPGFQEGSHFDRPVSARCLFCHCNFADAVEGSDNRYREPIFSGLTIGCERCHGPGELHVKHRIANEGTIQNDDTIVNPRRLDPVTRDSVCEQCHLQGEDRVLRRGREAFDYRPGLPLHLFWSAFVRLPELNPSPRSVGQVEQIHQSRCFQKSDGKLACISCHDPHAQPQPENRIAFYRERCLKCHETKGCTVPIVERKKQQDDNCMACHMSKAGSSNIPHTAVTDHRILRRPETGPAKKPRMLKDKELPIVPFHKDRTGLDSSESNRDLGLALSELIRRVPEASEQLTPVALPLLEEATRQFPTDEHAWEGLGLLYSSIGRLSESLASYDMALAIKPDLEGALAEVAMVTAGLGRPEEAIGYWERAIRVNPTAPRYYLRVARLQSARNDWNKALTAADQAIKLEPITVDGRWMRLTALIRLGRKEEARAEYASLLRLQPAEASRLKEMFESQLK